MTIIIIFFIATNYLLPIVKYPSDILIHGAFSITVRALFILAFSSIAQQSITMLVFSSRGVLVRPIFFPFYSPETTVVSYLALQVISEFLAEEGGRAHKFFPHCHQGVEPLTLCQCMVSPHGAGWRDWPSLGNPSSRSPATFLCLDFVEVACTTWSKSM